MTTITLWGRANSANVQKVLWALAELGLGYEHVPLGGSYGGLDEPAYLAMNPNGLVPTLRDGDVTIWESHAILRYLAATHRAGTLWPEDAKIRAIADQWTDWTATTFQPAWIAAFWLSVRTPADRQDSEAIARAVAATNTCMAMLDARLAGRDYLVGERLTYADIAAGAALHRWFTMPVAREAAPHVLVWYDRLAEREAFRTTIMVSYEELVGRLAF